VYVFSLTPPAAKSAHFGVPCFPRLVVMTMTPLADCVPYSVAAEGPFTISMLSISSGFRLFRKFGRPPPMKVSLSAPAMFGLPCSTRTPSTITSGSLESDADDKPRIRTREPPPTVPFDAIMVTPAVRPLRTSCIAVMGWVVVNSPTSIFATALPSSRVSCCPVAVVTTPSIWYGARVSAMSAVVASPARTVTDCVTER
jgi:hypothetical protein